MIDKIKRYKQLAVKKPKYYVSIGDIYIEEGAFKAATIYYQKAVDNGVLAYTVLGDTWGYRSQYKKAFDVYTEGANKGEAECFARLGFCYETGYVKRLHRQCEAQRLAERRLRLCGRAFALQPLPPYRLSAFRRKRQ